MNPDLEVATEELRRSAATVADTAARVTGLAARAPVADPAPRWATTDAASLAAAAARRRLGLLGDDLGDAAGQVSAAAADYETADTRAAERLRQTR